VANEPILDLRHPHGPAATRRLATLALLIGTAALLPGCIPARIVETQGRQVTFAWDARETRIARVHTLAIDFCHRWNAPPALLDDQVDGYLHRTTFVCRPRETMPIRRIF
jgi:YD repeat-containing protein